MRVLELTPREWEVANKLLAVVGKVFDGAMDPRDFHSTAVALFDRNRFPTYVEIESLCHRILAAKEVP